MVNQGKALFLAAWNSAEDQHQMTKRISLQFSNKIQCARLSPQFSNKIQCARKISLQFSNKKQCAQRISLQFSNKIHSLSKEMQHGKLRFFFWEECREIFASYSQNHLTKCEWPGVRVSDPGSSGKIGSEKLRFFWGRVCNVLDKFPPSFQTRYNVLDKFPPSFQTRYNVLEKFPSSFQTIYNVLPYFRWLFYDRRLFRTGHSKMTLIGIKLYKQL